MADEIETQEEKKPEILDISKWNELTRNIVSSAADLPAMTALVTQATEQYSALYATHANTAKENETLKKENENLRKANMDLFLRIGEQTAQNNGTPQETKSRAEKITINDLFKKEET